MTETCHWCELEIKDKFEVCFQGKHYHVTCFEVRKLKEIQEQHKKQRKLSGQKFPWNLIAE